MPLPRLKAECSTPKADSLGIVAHVAGILFRVFAVTILAAESFFLLIARSVDVKLPIALPEPWEKGSQIEDTPAIMQVINK